MLITAEGVLLTADRDTRTLTYRLLPHNEPGRTNVGLVTATKGCITLPTDPSALRLNREHVKTDPLGKGVSLADEDDALTASFAIARTRAGDDLLEEAAEGLRTGISVEIEDPVIQAGKITGGTLTGAGAVVEPAFPSALLVASDVGEPETPPVPGESDEDENDETEGNQPEAEHEETNVTTAPALAAAAAAAPAGLTAAATKGPEAKTAHDVFALFASAAATKDPVLLAALADITQTAIGGDVAQAQWLGELWSGRAFARIIVPLFNHGDLTSFKVDGWRWKVPPAVDTYLGDKADVPSNAVDTEAQSVPAVRLAGAHDIDRIYRDFDVAGFWESYFRALTESYARKSDAKALADAIANSTAVTPGAVPSGVSKGMAALVDGALAILPVAIPSFAVMGSALYRDVLLTRSDDTLAYLNASLGLEDGSVQSFRIVPSAATALVGKVLVGAREAMTVHELPGSPVRAEALNVAQAGVDAGLFGYMADVVHDKAALAMVTTA